MVLVLHEGRIFGTNATPLLKQRTQDSANDHVPANYLRLMIGLCGARITAILLISDGW